jgi:hypothetical protein
VARRVRQQVDPAAIEGDLETGEGLRKWVRWLAVPPSDGTPLTALDTLEPVAIFHRLGTSTDLSGRVERYLDLLADLPWPYPPGERNPHGYRTFLDSAQDHLRRHRGK